MSKLIAIELSTQGINKAIRELERYKRDIVPKMDEVCKRLAEIGRNEALAIINGIRLQDGNAVERVDVVQIDNGYKLVMEGEDVYFIEFGTGDGVSAHYETSVPVAWGSWSSEHSRMLFTKGFWYYDDTRYTGTTAYMPMYYAEKKMREEAKRIAEEVFGE